MAPEKVLGQVLRDQRIAVGLSQETLAHESGLQRNYVSLLERGLKSATVRTLFKLSPILNLPVSEILRRVEQRLTSSSMTSAPSGAEH